MPQTAPAPQARQRRIQLAALAMAAVVCLGVILALALEVQRRLDALARASSDNVQWTLAQLEVELLKLHGATQAALNTEPGTAPDLNDLRLRFDIFYSRVRTLETSAAFEGLRAVPDFGAGLTQARTFLNRTAPLIDGPDARLAAALPRIAADVAALATPARMMSLDGLSVFVDVASGQRLAVAATLRKVATLTVLLVMALSAALLVLARLYRRGQAQAAENELIRARLEAIINGSVEAIVVVDEAGRILEFNPAAVAIFGHPRDRALRAEAAGLLFPPERRAAAQAAIAASLRGDPLPGAGPTVEFEAQRACGARFPVEAAVAPVATRGGGLLVAMLRDISRRRQIERETTEARDRALAGERARAEFQALMSHEMRTPLNGLLGAMEVLHATRLDARQSELLQMMQTSGRLLLHHVNSVLDLSRAESGAVGQERVPFTVEEVVAEVIANQQGLAAAAGNTLQVVTVSGPVGRVLGDPVSLRQILLNLVGNAVKFTRQGRVSVEIEAGVDRTPDGTPVTELRVIDTGIGIAESDLARIFDDFVTLDSGYRRQVGGTGLGLGIARRLVEALGGEMGVESEPGSGSLFWVRLPLAPAPDDPARPAPQAADDSPRPAPPLRVLLVEDNAINRFVARSLLEEAGHTVTEATHGAEGVARAAAQPFDVILMDISMPRLDGVEATRAIRAGGGASAGARIVALTAHAPRAESATFRAAGIDACVEKPVTRSLLDRALRSLGGDWPAPAEVPGPPPRNGPARGPAEPDPGAAAPLHDRARMAEFVALLGADQARTLTRRFLADAEAAVAQIAAPLRDDDEDRRARGQLCHRLAGSAATFGALRLRQNLLWIEAALDRGAPARRLRTGLPDLWRRTRAEILADTQPAPDQPAATAQSA